MLKTTVEVKIVVEGTHFWPDAPESVGFLAHPHRHQFVIRAAVNVTLDDREIEFFTLAQEIRGLMRGFYEQTECGIDFGRRSCEMIAKELIGLAGLTRCSVHEDDENGAIVTTE